MTSCYGEAPFFRADSYRTLARSTRSGSRRPCASPGAACRHASRLPRRRRTRCTHTGASASTVEAVADVAATAPDDDDLDVLMQAEADDTSVAVEWRVAPTAKLLRKKGSEEGAETHPCPRPRGAGCPDAGRRSSGFSGGREQGLCGESGGGWEGQGGEEGVNTATCRSSGL